MFHPEIIAAKKAAIEKKTNRNLIEYSVAYCVQQYEHFLSITRTDGKRIFYARTPDERAENFKYTQDEADFISNELYMCSCSFLYWFYRYFFIKDKANVIRRPDVLYAQQVFIDILATLDLKRLPIKLLILKARQLGMSTIVEAIILWIALFRRGSKCLIASAQEDKSMAMSNMVWIALERLPLWASPALTRDDRKLGPEFGKLDTEISIQHGAMSKGIGRGETPVAVHLTEVPYFADPGETVEASLLNAIHENDRTFVVLEFTARRKGDWTHNRWLREREGEKEGRNEFICLFLPWYMGRDKYPTPAWLRNHPIPENWKPLKETLKQAADARLYVATMPLLRKYLGENWEMPIEQMWCWEHRYVIAKRTDITYKKFLAEFASDERSAFQSARSSVFAQEILDEMERRQCKEPRYYAFAGDGIDKRFNLEDFQSQALSRVDIQWQSLEGKSWNWKLIPLRAIPKEQELDFYLQVFEHPKPGYDYTIGIDIASGVGQNRTVYFVNRVGKNGEPDKEAALLCTGWMLSPETPGFALALGAYYGQYMMPFPEAKIAPEVQRAVGDFISSQLAHLGYTNLYFMDRWDIRRPPGYRPQRRGWVSTGWSQQYMMENMEHAIKSGWIEVQSSELVKECGQLECEETEGGKVIYDHERSGTNDVYVAGGIAYTVSHSHDTIIERIKGNLSPKRKEEKTEDGQKKDSGLTLLARAMAKQDRDIFPNAGSEGQGDEFANIF